jgi:hypothetical protein
MFRLELCGGGGSVHLITQIKLAKKLMIKCMFATRKEAATLH